MAMDSFPTFFTVRAITFACIVLLALIWLILVSVEVFTRWSISDNTSQSLMFLLILTNAITIFIPPFLSILEFRIWLDAARLLLMFVLQTGAATAFTCWSPQIQCPNQSASDIGVCKLLNAYTVMGSWVIPVICNSVTLQSLLRYLGIYAVPDTCHSGVSQNCSVFCETVGITHYGPRNGREAVFDLSRIVGLRAKYTKSLITHRPSATAAHIASTPIDARSAKPISFHESTAPQILTCNTPH
ncbi:hypothetical protein EDD15DRAFT_1923653 [Pisolithus albus]|nr:hypothetical protein EDD15DRAFT_1923653 [Pisolithus albus]